MRETRLILVEGLSGMGKTTLTKHLGERIPDSRPWFELDEDHPIILGHDTHAPDYADHMVGQWRAYADSADGRIAIFDSRFWQNTTMPMFRSIYTPDEVRAYHNRVVETIRPLDPVLVFFAASDVRAHMQSLYTMRDRGGKAWVDKVIDRDLNEPWYRERNLTGFDGWAECFVAWHKFADDLFTKLPFPKLRVQDPHQNREAANREIEAFLQLAP